MTEERTTINVTKETHLKAKEAKQDGESWDDYLLRCINEPATLSNDGFNSEEVAHQITAELDVDASDAHAEIDELVEKVEHLDDLADMTGIGYDDVVSACRKAIREELPVDQMGGR